MRRCRFVCVGVGALLRASTCLEHLELTRCSGATDEALAISFDLGIAALVGEGLYNFGEARTIPGSWAIPFLTLPSGPEIPCLPCSRALA